MKKRILSLILAAAMMASALLIGCNDTFPINSQEETPLETPAESPVETPKETPADTPAETDPVEPPTPEYDPAPEEGTLLFYEDFEDVDLGLDSPKTVAALGWTALGSDNSAYSDGTASFTVKELNGSRALYIQNYDGKTAGKSSYLEILSSEQFGFLHGKSYTYQYDVTYTTASAGSQYINIISEHNGGFYNTYHLRNAGYAHNQCCVSGSFYRYATTYTDENSVATKLLGKKYVSTVQVLSNVTVSVRYVVDWQKGNSVYVRSFDEKAVSPGEWILVSAFDPTQPGAEYFTPDAGGAAMVLKVSGGQNGYVDNITIWSGTGDEPDDKNNAYLTPSAECHRMVKDGDEVLCALCGRGGDAIEFGWLLEGVPAYEWGITSASSYVSGQGIDATQKMKNEDLMQLVSETNAEEFEKYIKKLENKGFVREFRREADGNIFASYVKAGIRVYAYYLYQRHEARVVRELTSVSSSLEDFGYVYEKQAGEQTVVYQYAMAMRDGSHFKADGYKDNGMFYIIKLADNSLVLIDGAQGSQFPESQSDNLMKMLRRITGTKDGETIKIAAWYITHAHGDHYGGFKEFSKKYAKNFELQRVFFALASTNSDNSAMAGGASGYKDIIGVIDSYYSDDEPEFLRLHTGQTFSLADMQVEVIYTHEDSVDAETAKSPITSYNDSSAVIRISVDGETILFMGDAQETAMSFLTMTWTGESLRSDGIQLAHHVLNDLSLLYHIVKAPVVLIPQSLHRIEEHKVSPKPYGAAKKYARQDMIFFQNTYTVGIAVVDGRWEKVYTLPVVYEIAK